MQETSAKTKTQAQMKLLAVAKKNGEVVYADKLDEPGAEWVVVGEDQDGRQYRLELVVISEVQNVTLRGVSPHGDGKEDSDDAA